MITSAENLLLDEALNGNLVPGMGPGVGNIWSAVSLKSYKSLTTNSKSPIYYNAAENKVVITGNGAIVSGYDFSGTNVVVDASNVTIKNCTFNDASGYYSLMQNAGYSGMTATNNTFNGGDNTELAAFVLSEDGYANVSGNKFIDAPSHDVQIESGVVSNNYMSGGGYATGAHADAIAVLSTTGPVMISGNYIDWTTSAGQLGVANEAIRLATEQGDTSNVTVENNVLLGGQNTIYADSNNSQSKGSFSNINITGNYIGDSVYGDFYAVMSAGVTADGNVEVGYLNPSYSSQAWDSYLASGLVTNNLVVAAAAGADITGAATGSTTLYGNGAIEHMYGTVNETVFVGGYGTQYLWGGSGKNIFTYLSIADSTATGGEDEIGNFDPTKDVIDLSRIDANLGKAGTQYLTFIGSAALSAAGGQVDYVQNVAKDETEVQVTLVGDSQADMVIRLSGLLTLTAANFALTAAQSAAATAPAAQVATVTDTASAGDLDAGKTVTINVNFSGAVVVSGGTPVLTLNDGGAAFYSGGSGTTALAFTYTVAAGQNASALAVAAVSLGGATIRDTNGENANLTAAVTSLPTAIQIDTTAPTVTGVSTSLSSGREITTGQSAILSLAMREVVKVTGAPVLLLDDGGTATYDAPLSTSTKLAFAYVAGKESTTGLAIAGIELPSSASILDLAGNAAVLSSAGADTGLAVNTKAFAAQSTGTGDFSLSGSTRMELFGSSDADITFAAGATGALVLDHSQSFEGIISGLTKGNVLDLADLIYGPGDTLSYTANSHGTGGELTVANGAHGAYIALLGNYIASNFSISNDGHGGTFLSDVSSGVAAPSLLAAPHS